MTSVAISTSIEMAFANLHSAVRTEAHLKEENEILDFIAGLITSQRNSIADMQKTEA